MGEVVTGKVTGITKFGAFVTIAPGKSGLVHISEISNTYVNDVNDCLKEGQEVSVKIISIDASGRINLSIKATLPPPPPRGERTRYGGDRPPRPERNQPPRQNMNQSPNPRPAQFQPKPQPTAVSFEDKLKRFMQDSDSKIAGVRQYADRKVSRRRNNNGNNGR